MPSGYDQLKHIIVVMMENRSFDHMVGYLRAENYLIDGIDGSQANLSADGSEELIHTSSNAKTSGDLRIDPGHEFIHTNHQIFGSYSASGTPDMQGFISDYYNESGDADVAKNIMKCFSPDAVPVISALAQRFAICDHWFSSVPGPTIPNRMFAHAATSLGSVSQDPLLTGLKTIFEIMDKDGAGNDYCIYQYGSQSILVSVDYLSDVQDTAFRDFSYFEEDCKNNDLPSYTFIEPCYSDVTIHDTFYPANSQHPNYDVAEGERFLLAIYNSIRAKKELWESSLLLIVYDEHGGIYDHKSPPAVPEPWVQSSSNPAFNFDRLGVRVPAILVSPFIKPGTICSTQFDHSSIVATVRKKFAPNSGPLTHRDAQANTFEGVMTLDSPTNDGPDMEAVGAALTEVPTLQAAADTQGPSDLAVAMTNGMDRMLKKKGLFTGLLRKDLKTAGDYSQFMLKAGEALRTAAAKARESK